MFLLKVVKTLQDAGVSFALAGGYAEAFHREDIKALEGLDEEG